MYGPTKICMGGEGPLCNIHHQHHQYPSTPIHQYPQHPPPSTAFHHNTTTSPLTTAFHHTTFHHNIPQHSQHSQHPPQHSIHQHQLTPSTIQQWQPRALVITSMRELLVILPFHVACLTANMHHWLNVIPAPETNDYWYYAKFLTMWGLFGHTVYFFLSTVDDLLHAYQILTKPNLVTRRKQNRHLDTFFRAFSFPLATIVATLFWGVYSVDRELIYPKALEAQVPVYMNHIQHTLPLVSVLIDMLLVDHSYNSKHLRLDLSMVAAVSMAYVSMLLYLFSTQGTWVYPFIGLLSNTAKALFFGFGVALSALFYYGGMVTSSRLWTITTAQTSKKAA